MLQLLLLEGVGLVGLEAQEVFELVVGGEYVDVEGRAGHVLARPLHIDLIVARLDRVVLARNGSVLGILALHLDAKGGLGSAHAHRELTGAGALRVAHELGAVAREHAVADARSDDATLGGVGRSGDADDEGRTGHVLVVVLDLEDVLARLLGLDVEREGAVLVVEELAEGDLLGAHAVSCELAGSGASRVDERLDVLAEHAHLDAVAAHDHLGRIGVHAHVDLVGRVAHLPVAPLDVEQVGAGQLRHVRAAVDVAAELSDAHLYVAASAGEANLGSAVDLAEDARAVHHELGLLAHQRLVHAHARDLDALHVRLLQRLRRLLILVATVAVVVVVAVLQVVVVER